MDRRPLSTPKVAALLALILALAAFLRWHGLTERGFFFDELWHVEVANGHGSAFRELPFDRAVDVVNPLLPANRLSVWQVPSHTTGVTHPPGAFVSLRLWMDVFGDSMASLRSWPATWSLLGVGLVFIAAAWSFGATAGLWAALLFAVAPANVDQAQDVRGYTMLQAIGLLATLPLLRLWRRGPSWPAAVGLGVGVMALMFTHYFAAGTCAALTIAAAALLRGRARWQALGAIAVAGVLWSLLWLPSLRAQLAFVDSADVFVLDDSAGPVVATFMRLAVSPYLALVADPSPLAPAALGSGVAACVLLGYRIARRGTGERAAITWLWLGLGAGALVTLLAMDLGRHSKHLEFPRYVVPAAPALCVLLGSLPTIRRVPLPAVVAVALAAAWWLVPFPPKPDLRPQLAYLNAHATPGDLILLPARPERPRDAQSRYLSLAYGLRWPSHRVALPVGPQPRAWVDALPREGRWFCLAFADYDPAVWQPGLVVVDRGPVSSGVAVFEVRRDAAAP